MHFVFILAVAWAALPPFVTGQGTVALAVAPLVTASAALGLWFESRHSVRWARWGFGFAVLVTGPFPLLGSDTWINERWFGYDTIFKEYRGWLAQLPSDQAQRIASGNALRLFGLQRE